MNLLIWMMLLLCRWLVGFISCHEGEHHMPSLTAEQIKEKINKDQWDVSDLVDIEHLERELKEVSELRVKGELTSEEASAYLFKSHDFDNNGMLDGLEIGAIIRHTVADNVTDEIVEKAVDGTLLLDLNNDGFLSYPELKVQEEKAKAAEPRSN